MNIVLDCGCPTRFSDAILLVKGYIKTHHCLPESLLKSKSFCLDWATRGLKLLESEEERLEALLVYNRACKRILLLEYPDVAKRPCYIQKLPAELLEEILAYHCTEITVDNNATWEQCPGKPTFFKSRWAGA